MRKLSLCLLTLCVSLLGCEANEEVRQIRTLDGMSAPESVLYDAARKSWFVSNVAGNEPGDGFISRLDNEGNLSEPRFVAGLNDPKGQRIFGGKLYVADNTQLVIVDLEDPTNVQRMTVEGSVFLNDVAVDPRNGNVYLSDTIANTIYRVADGVADVVLQTPDLESPNGLLYEAGGLLIASVGPDLDPATFTTSAPGHVQFLNLADQTLTPISERFGGLDGIERDDRGLLVSDFFVGVYRLQRDGSADLLIDSAARGLGASADIGVDPRTHRVAVPNLWGTSVNFYSLDLEHELAL